ncbi:chlorophyllide reductase subunit Y, partial [Methylobacterium hispanicum]
GSLAEVVNAAMGNRDRFAAMRGFFEGVGTGHAAGIWQERPRAKAAVTMARAPERPIGEMA